MIFRSKWLKAAALAATLAVSSCSLIEPAPAVIVWTTDRHGVPFATVDGEGYPLTDEERRDIANALIREYAPNYCD